MVAGFSLQQYMGDLIILLFVVAGFLLQQLMGNQLLFSIIVIFHYHENGAKKECGLNSRLHPFFTLQVDFVGSHS